MTSLIDVHAPQYDISQSLVFHVDAAPDAVMDAADRLGRDPFAGTKVLGHARRERLFALTWTPTPGAPGHVEVVWDIRVEHDEDGGSYVSSTRRFVASDADAREALLANWRDVRPVADTVARYTLRTIKRAAEERPAVARRPELLLVAA